MVSPPPTTTASLLSFDLNSSPNERLPAAQTNHSLSQLSTFPQALFSTWDSLLPPSLTALNPSLGLPVNSLP